MNPNPEIILCPYVVKTAPTTPAAASSIFYDIDVCLPSGIETLTHIQPQSDRPPDEIDTQPIKINTIGLAYLAGENLQISMAEREAYGPCQGTQARNPGDGLLRTVMGMTTDQRNALRVLLGAGL